MNAADTFLSIFGFRRVTDPVPPFVTDRRKYAAQSHHGYKTRARPIAKVTGACLHQTACVLGERPERYDGIGAHLAITRAGQVIWLHSFDRLVVHGNGWNNGTIGIEIDGIYAGVEGDPRTVWPAGTQPQRLTDETVKAALMTLEWIRTAVPSVRVVVAHRQSSASRRADPGEAIWKRIALVSGMEMAPDTVLGDGLPIPREWWPGSDHRY